MRNRVRATRRTLCNVNPCSASTGSARCISAASLCSREPRGTPCLVFEATFDGPRADFLQELWRIAPEGMHDVYKNCLGYPQSGLDVPELIQDYLIRHDAGAHTFFSGCPGRSVAQIQGESQLRADLVTFLIGAVGNDRRQPGDACRPATDNSAATSFGSCQRIAGPSSQPWCPGQWRVGIGSPGQRSARSGSSLRARRRRGAPCFSERDRLR